jgi:hypothetical protein
MQLHYSRHRSSASSAAGHDERRPAARGAAAEFWVFCADFNRLLQICPDAQLGLAEQLLLGRWIPQ